MRLRTKILLKIWGKYLLFCFFWWAIVWVNIHRLQDNLYANYEKTVDYGRVREVKESVDPVIAAVFYQGQQLQTKNIATYISHSDNYKKHNVRMVVVSPLLKQNNRAVIKRLYTEIKKYNDIDEVSLVYTKGDDWKSHLALLRSVMGLKNVRAFYLSEDDVSAERKIAKSLRKPRSLVVFLADLGKGLKQENSDFLLEEAMYFAQENFYRLDVFDIIDTQIARAIEKDYTALFSLTAGANVSTLTKQKNNLKMFATNYKDELFKYFLLNLDSQAEKAVWPQKTPRIYRLFDRGDVYVKLLDEEYFDIFGYGRVGRNESILITLISIARKASKRLNLRNVKYIKLYFLTELEEIRYRKGTLLSDYLEADDGIVARYENFYTIMLADDRPDVHETLIDVLRHKAGVPMNAEDSDIKFYKFKTVEVEYEN